MTNKFFNAKTQSGKDAKKRVKRFLKIFASLHLCVFALIFFSVLTTSAQIAVKGETVWTMTGAPLANGVVLIGANGKIERVGANLAIPANYKVLTAKVVTPGLIDAHSVIGLNGYLNQPHDQMALDGSNLTHSISLSSAL